MAQTITDDDISTIESVSGSGSFGTMYGPAGGLTQAQIAAIKLLVAWIKTHPGG